MSSGGLRRALVRVREAAQDTYGQIRGDFSPLASLSLFTFANADDIQKFQVTTDRVLGGKTDANFCLKPYTSFTSGCFEGIIDYRDDNPQSKGGFASFRTKADERIRDLSAFEGIEMRVKMDGRGYIANFKSADHSAEQLWQVKLSTSTAPGAVNRPGAWTTLGIPFRDMVLTRRGRVEANQVPLHRDTFNGFGILLADGSNGPFRFEMQWMRAVYKINPAEYNSAPEQLLLEQQQLALQQPQQQQREGGGGGKDSSILTEGRSSNTGNSTSATTNNNNNNNTNTKEALLAAHRAKAKAAKLDSSAGEDL